MSTKDDKKATEPYSLHAIYFKLPEMATNSKYSAEDFEYLDNEWKKQNFKNYDLHCSAQRQYLMLRGSIQGNQIPVLMEPEFAKIKPLTFSKVCGFWWRYARLSAMWCSPNFLLFRLKHWVWAKNWLLSPSLRTKRSPRRRKELLSFVERVLISAGMWTNQTLLRITIILRSTRSLIRLRLLRILARRLQRRPSQRSTSSLTSAASVPRPSPSPRLNI